MKCVTSCTNLLQCVRLRHNNIGYTNDRAEHPNNGGCGGCKKRITAFCMMLLLVVERLNTLTRLFNVLSKFAARPCKYHCHNYMMLWVVFMRLLSGFNVFLYGCKGVLDSCLLVKQSYTQISLSLFLKYFNKKNIKKIIHYHSKVWVSYSHHGCINFFNITTNHLK